MITLVEQKVKFTQAKYGGAQLWNKRLSSENHDNDQRKSVVLIATSVSHKNKPSCWENIYSPHEIQQDYTILQVVLNIEMITLFMTTLCGISGMLTMMDNLGQIGTALRSLIFAITFEIFGLKHCSTLTNVGQMACQLGSFLLNVKVIGFLYDKKAEKQLRAVGLERKHGEGLNCTGGQCYRLSFIIITIVAFLGVLRSSPTKRGPEGSF
ncbi:hypothetical protein FF2_040536 [Malus domestica]